MVCWHVAAGAIQHAIVAAAAAPFSARSGGGAAACSVEGDTSASLRPVNFPQLLSFLEWTKVDSFTLSGAPVSIVTAVRTSRDPSCVARPTTIGTQNFL